MRLGMIARADEGGLAAMLIEFYRHVRPDRVLVAFGISRDGARGTSDPERWYGDAPELRVARGAPTPADVEWLLSGCDRLYSAETFYGAVVNRRRRRTATLLHVMPEFYDGTQADLLLAPTHWRMPDGAVHLPVPIARDRLPVRPFRPVTTLYHVASPTPGGERAGDRNGTELLRAALDHVQHPCRLIVRDHRASERAVTTVGHVTVDVRPHAHGGWWEHWPDDVDAFVQPRRYAGLSLPMQEAWSLGIPVVALDREPERTWLDPRALVPVAGEESVHVWRRFYAAAAWCTPEALAARVDELLTDHELARTLAGTSAARGDLLAWPGWVESYRAILADGPAAVPRLRAATTVVGAIDVAGGAG